MEHHTMDRSKLQALANELAKDLKTPEDLNMLSQELVKLTVEAALNAEITHHLGYEKHRNSFGKDNARNGTTSKRLKGSHGEVVIDAPRDRDGSFEPQIVAKHQTRLTSMDDQILTLYAKGLSTREIVGAFKEMYDADVSAKSIGITRVCRDTTPLLPKSLPKPSYEVVFLLALIDSYGL